MQFDESSLDTLRKDGVLLTPSFLKSEKINQIRKEISGWDKINFNHQVGSQIIGGNLWIENLGVCSETALKIALDPDLLKLLDNYFQEKTILGTLKYQKKLKGQPGIPIHSDRGPGIVMFIFLKEISHKTGATRFIKGSHLIDVKSEVGLSPLNDADYINKEKSTNKGEPFAAYGREGTVVLYSQKTWHDLPSFKKPGREILWAIYYPISESSLAEDQLFRHNILINLSTAQRERLFHENKAEGLSFTKFGNSKSFIDSYAIAPWKIFLYVIRYHFYQILTKFTGQKET